MSRVILHADCNSFYVSCEMSYNPKLRGKAVAVCGDPEARHGIVLAKSDKAKALGVKTGQAIWQAQQLCPGLIVLPPDYNKYLHFAKSTRKIFSQYTDKVEPYGMDEAWLDVSGSYASMESGKKAADEIRRRLWYEMGITGSVGVADNKVFAKLGSDYKKPNATTIIDPDNYQQIVWPLPVGDLLFVGPAKQQKLKNIAINTIGELAKLPESVPKLMFGKVGSMLWQFANGHDDSPVNYTNAEPDIKSIGNSTTTPRDLVNDEDIKLTLFVLAESVAARLREHGYRARTVQIYVRDKELKGFERQLTLKKPSQLCHELVGAAMELFRANHNWDRDQPIRSLGVRGTNLVPANGYTQISMFAEENRQSKQEIVERTIDRLRDAYGHFIIQRGLLLSDAIGDLNPKDDHGHAFNTDMSMIDV